MRPVECDSGSAGCGRLTGLVLAIFLTGLVAASELPDEPEAAGSAVYLIEFSEPGLLKMVDDPGQLRSPAAESARALLRAAQSHRVQEMNRRLGREVEVTHRYLVTHSGIAARLSAPEVELVARIPGVARVERESIERIVTYRGPTFIGADGIWDGSAVPDGGTRGGGVVIGVLDTGIDPTHPSFQDDPACGHGVDLPDKLLGAVDCSTTDPDGLCNGGSPQDDNGHGSHTAGTSGGNRIGEDAIPPPDPPGPFTEITGVAPCASLRIYKVCPQSNCPTSQVIAGINHAIEDGVDVINFSISGGRNPWSINDSDFHFLAAVDAGIFVAAAAGNTGPQISDPVGQVNHRGPWVTSVAASTHDAVSPGLISVSGPGEPPENLRNLVASKGSHAPHAPELQDLLIRHFPGQDEAYEGCTPGEDGVPPDAIPFPPDYFDGVAALILRGTCPFTTKITNAYLAGAELAVIRNHEPQPINMITIGQPDIPAYMLNLGPGAALFDFVSANPDSATIDIEPILGDVLADFSLRGPTPLPLANLTKPDISAPGVSIYAPWPPEPSSYASVSGTSMASPHVAGAAALLRAIHADWTPAEIKSALQLTAICAGRKESLVEPWNWDDVGSGRVDVSRAVRSGLVMHESTDNFVNANPATGGDPRALNVPSLRNVSCTPQCSFTRTLTSSLDQAADWTVTIDSPAGFEVLVEPVQFGLAPGESREIQVMAAPLPGEPGSQIRFGAINLDTAATTQVPAAHLTLALQGTGPEDRPVIHVNLGSIDVTLETGDTSDIAMLIGNPGIQLLEWNIPADPDAACDAVSPPWIDVQPNTGTVAPGEAGEVNVAIHTEGLPVASHEAQICILSNDPVDPVIMIPVNLEVIELIMEADLSVEIRSSSGFLPIGQEVQLEVLISNAGPRDVSGGEVLTALDSGLIDIQWLCDDDGAGSCTESGTGNILDSFSIATGENLSYTISATVLDAGDDEQIINTVLVVSPDGLSDPQPGNNLHSQTLQAGVFADHFE